jgi:hypothetical protein
MLPIGFQTVYKSYIKKPIEALDAYIESLPPKEKPEDPFLVDCDAAKRILNEIFSTYEIDEATFVGDTLKAIATSMDYLSKNTGNLQQRNKVWCLVRTGRSIARYREAGRLENSPDTPQREGVIAKKIALDTPILLLFRQEGKEESGWRGHPFWWPVLVTPQNTPTVIFANETT